MHFFCNLLDPSLGTETEERLYRQRNFIKANSPQVGVKENLSNGEILRTFAPLDLSRDNFLQIQMLNKIFNASGLEFLLYGRMRRSEKFR